MQVVQYLVLIIKLNFVETDIPALVSYTDKDFWVSYDSVVLDYKVNKITKDGNKTFIGLGGEDYIGIVFVTDNNIFLYVYQDHRATELIMTIDNKRWIQKRRYPPRKRE